jgi:ribosome-binding protein aMBF1 (putative translation factor)
MTMCDACGRDHSSNCRLIDYSGKKFNVCGECIVAVRENPADFLAGKKGTDTQAEDFNPCGPNR